MPLSGCHILIVEDDFLIGEHIAEAVRDAGGEAVGPFPTMIEALDRLSDLVSVDGAILDVGLKNEASYPLAEALQTTRIPFLFLTGLHKRDLPEKFAAVPHVRKPVTARALVEALVDCGIGAARA